MAINKDELRDQFYKAYHTTPLINMAKAIKEHLETPAYDNMRDCRHWQYLHSRMESHIRDHRAGSPDELPGMVYGMYCEAFRQLLAEM